MNVKACVYAIRHEPTGKVYVGCSKNVERRLVAHMNHLISGTHPVKMMQDDFDEYGGDYSYFILFEAYAAYDAFEMEKHFMSLLGTRNPDVGYNYKDNSNDFSLKNLKRHKLYVSNKKLTTRPDTRIAKTESKKKVPTWITAVKEYRLKAGMTQMELAEKSGISRYTIIKIERNSVTTVNTETIKKLAAALEVRFTDLIGI